MKKQRPIILVFCAWYLPGFKAGGPVRTIANMVEALGNDFFFKIVTADRDYGDKHGYTELPSDQWYPIGKADVYYCSPKTLSYFGIKNILQKTDFDALYLNSFFSPHFTILPLLLQWLGVKNKVPVIVAPRGEFFAGARSIKKIKKNLFIKLSRFFNLYHNVIWQASSEMESFEINKIFSFKAENSRVMIARNVSGAGISNSLSISSSTKFAGTARIVFISRISPIKNLDMAIQILSQASGKIVFDIYGPQVDIAYWNKCLEYIAQLPPNITARYCGELSHNAVSNTFSEYDAFLFPTGGENFGHVIVEALSSGCPVIISDRTSWNHIASQNVGYVVPLDDITGFITAINNIINMDNQVHQSMRLSAKKLGLSLLSVPEDIDHNRDLFLKVLNSTNKQY